MDDHNYIKIVLEGKLSNDKMLFGDFAIGIQKLNNLLNSLSQKFSDSEGEPQYEFELVDLTHNSPAAVGIWQNHKHLEQFDYEESPFNGLNKILANPEDADVDTDADILKDIQDFCDYTTKKLKRAMILNGSEHSFDASMEERADKVLKTQAKFKVKDTECFVSYEGVLQKIDLHGNKSEFTIYPLMGPSKIKCYFPENLIDMACEAIRKKVLVKGRGKYTSNSLFPSEIKVEKLEIYEQNENKKYSEFPNKKLDITGGKSSEDFINDIRKEWDSEVE